MIIPIATELPERSIRFYGYASARTRWRCNITGAMVFQGTLLPPSAFTHPVDRAKRNPAGRGRDPGCCFLAALGRAEWRPAGVAPVVNGALYVAYLAAVLV